MYGAFERDDLAAILAHVGPFEVAAVHVWTIVDGRATRFDAHIDTPAMRAALG